MGFPPFFEMVFLCSLGWPWTHSPPSQAPESWDYRFVSPCLDSLIFKRKFQSVAWVSPVGDCHLTQPPNSCPDCSPWAKQWMSTKAIPNARITWCSIGLTFSSVGKWLPYGVNILGRPDSVVAQNEVSFNKHPPFIWPQLAEERCTRGPCGWVFAGGLRPLKTGGDAGVSHKGCKKWMDWKGAENRLWLLFAEPSVAAPLSPGGAVHVFHMCERAWWLWFSVLFHGTFHPAPLIYVVTLFLSDFPSVSGLARVCIQGCSRN